VRGDRHERTPAAAGLATVEGALHVRVSGDQVEEVWLDNL
jgi:hypothetical protein